MAGWPCTYEEWKRLRGRVRAMEAKNRALCAEAEDLIERAQEVSDRNRRMERAIDWMRRHIRHIEKKTKERVRLLLQKGGISDDEARALVDQYM